MNTLQQAMMETVFILLGFSGDDPNFIAWSQWVQQNLRESAPRIFLAGWFGLSDEEKKDLQTRNVVVIDLAWHSKASLWPQHLRYKYALDWILSSLEAGRPYDVTNWPTHAVIGSREPPAHLLPVEVVDSDKPKEEPWPDRVLIEADTNEDSVLQTLKAWRHNRKIYPGWLMAPLEVRSSIAAITRAWEPYILQALSNLAESERLCAIRELIWRHEITLEPFSSDLESAASDALDLIDCEAGTVNGVANCHINWMETRDAYREVALALITVARFQLDECKFSQRITIAGQFIGDNPDVAHRITHERCLWAVWSLDFEELDDLLSNWKTENSDQVWKLRKAALLHEAGRDDEAKGLIGDAMTEVRRFPLMTEVSQVLHGRGGACGRRLTTRIARKYLTDGTIWHR